MNKTKRKESGEITDNNKQAIIEWLMTAATYLAYRQQSVDQNHILLLRFGE